MLKSLIPHCQNILVELLKGAEIEKKDVYQVSKEAKKSLISVQCRDSRKMDMASAPLLGRTTTVEDNKTQVNLEKGVSSHQIIVSRSNLEEEKRQEGLQKSDHSCSDAIAESKEDTTSLGQSLRELKMDMAKSQNQRYIHTTYKSITI